MYSKDMKIKRLNDKLINSFRDKVNEFYWVLHIYKNINSKDKWSIICSAMDWINVSIDGIRTDTLLKENGHEASRRVISFISCIDILFESICQLHKVFFKTEDKPFKDDDTIFKNKLFSASDNKYFKTIRACFAAHPVDLTDYFTGNKTEKRYASWSGGLFGKNDFSVLLYSDDKNIPFITMNICFNELMEFASHRYKYLKTIMKEIDRQIKEHIEVYRKKAIIKVTDPLKQINILISELKKRLENDYYSYELTKLKILFETPISNEKMLLP